MTKTEHKSAALARLFYLELLKIHGNAAWPAASKSDALARLLELLFIETTKAENIQFTTLFARIAFACHKLQVEKKTQYWVHFFRKKIRSLLPEGEAEKVYALGLKAVADSIAGLFGAEPPEEVATILPKKIPYAYTEVKVKEFKKQVRVIALQDDEANDRLIAQDEDSPAEFIYIQYNIAERNEPFSPTIRAIREVFGFPVTLSLLDVEIVEESAVRSPQSAVHSPQSTVSSPQSDSPITNHQSPITNHQSPITNHQSLLYRPRAIVVEPDYLLDVSAVANCFQGSGAEPVVYLLQKFLPVEPSIPMIVGNIANFFLDELMHNPQAAFKETFPKVFKLNPLAFSLLPDAAIREIHQTTQKHWVTLQLMVMQGMKKFDIEPSACYLEPSFYDEKHGLQGRLDIFYQKGSKSAIIELKSGSAFMPNRYGIGASHFIQTLLYDLMVRSTFGEAVEPASYILYSKMETGQLKYAPPVKSEQNEALQLRNQLVALDHQLAAIQGKVDKAPVLEKINSARFPHIKGFHRRDIELFEKTYTGLSELERRYFNAFTGFIAREHQLAKTGVQGLDKANGLAALWLDTLEEKEDNYQIIKCLKIKENRVQEDEPLIVFEKTQKTNQLANFRVGDIAVLYPVSQPPVTNHQSPVTSHQLAPSGSPFTTQIFKVTILAITPEEVTVRLRYRQFNPVIFGEYENWNLEHDQMDMSFTAMYQGLFRFAQSPAWKRDLLLTKRSPNVTANFNGQEQADGLPIKIGSYTGLTAEQNRILQKMLSAQDYFLLWGPPGTGKTSQMLKHYAGWIFENTDENLLLLAYTNRAVDEICEALDNLGEKVRDAYLRIGSQYSTGEDFEGQLLGKKIEGISTRAELKTELGRHRIFVSTLASLTNNLEVLKLKKFRRVVIDEASQILEPVLVGLLPHFEQFVLVGDHKQLPAVVVQDATASAVEDEQLQKIGLQNLRNSLFERLYRRCLEENWHWAFDLLSHQGRMHEEIMRFPCEHFYEGKLKILPAEIAYSQKQVAALSHTNGTFQNDWEQLVVRKRLVFLPTKIDFDSPSRKTNRHEAELIAGLVRFFKGQFAVGSPQSEVSSQQSAVHSPQSAVHSPQSPITNHQSPVTNHQSPITNHQSIGIITPYRAQIALIQEVLQSAGIDCDKLTIDTVERYQGGARDIILISLCTNAASQMDSLVSLSEEGVDRKLNVALTRAREHVVILGNEGVLERNEVYRKLIEFCR